MSNKMLVVLDYPHEDFFDKVNPTKIRFDKSKIGKIILKALTGKRVGAGIREDDLDFYFVHPTVVSDKQYISNATKQEIANANNYIIATKPKMVIMYGNFVANNLLGLKLKDPDAPKRRKLAGMYEPFEFKFEVGEESYTAYVSVNPSVAGLANSNRVTRDRLSIETRFIKRFYQKGKEGLVPVVGKYKLYNNIEDIHVLFNQEVYKHDIIACDFETNTLQTWKKGAKAIMFSMSYREHQGIAIPLTSKYFNDNELKIIMKYICDLMMSDTLKVFHNGMFDIRMLKDIYNLKYANNYIDTLAMYYIGYAEEQGAPRGLKHLAYLFTDMGGYENKRDKYFEDFLKKDYEDWYDKEQIRLNKEAEKNNKKPKKPKRKDYNPPVNSVDGGKVDFSWLDMNTIYMYAAADTDVDLQLYHIFDKKIRSNKKWVELIYNFYPNLCETLTEMEHNGFHVDTQKNKSYLKFFTKYQQDLVKKMYETVPEITELENSRYKLIEQKVAYQKAFPKVADRTKEVKKIIAQGTKYMGTNNKGVAKYKFSPNSKVDVGYIMFAVLGYELPADKDYLVTKAVNARKMNKPETITWKDYSVSSTTTLPYLAKNYNSNFAKLLIQYAKINKLLSTYVGSFPSMVDEKGNLHPSFLITGTATGRLSSKQPNAQNVPKPVHNVNSPIYSYPIKGLFTSRFKGGIILNCDYKTLEVYIAAMLSQDKGVIQALLNGDDIHKRNASIAFGVPLDQVTKDLRQLAKSVN